MTTKKTRETKTPTSPSLKYKSSLPDEIQVRLLEILSSPQRLLNFSHVVKDDRRFGDPGSPLRAKILNRKRYLEEILANDPERFLGFFGQYNVRIPPTFAKQVRAQVAAKRTGVKFALPRQESEPSSLEDNDLSSESSSSSSIPPPSSLKPPPKSKSLPPVKVESNEKLTTRKVLLETKSPVPSVSIMTSPSKRMTLAALHDCDDVFELDFAVSLRNKHLILPYRNMTSTRLLFPNVMFEMLSIITPVMDIRDVFENRYEAELCVDDREKGIGVIITMPRLPKYIYSNAAEIHDRFTLPEVGLQRLQCHNARLEHTGVGVKIETMSEREKTKRILCLFPPGVTCSKKFLNEDQKGQQLFRIFQKVSLKFQIVKQPTPRSIPFFGPFVMWQLCIEEQIQDLAVPVKRDNEAELQGAFAGLTFVNTPHRQGCVQPPHASFHPHANQVNCAQPPAPPHALTFAPIAVPPMATNPTMAPPMVVDLSITATDPIPTPPVVTSPPVAAAPPVVASPPVAATPPIVNTPPVATAPPVVTSPPVAAAPPVVTSPPVVTAPPVVATPASTQPASIARAPHPRSPPSHEPRTKRAQQKHASPNKASKVMRKVLTGFGAISEGGRRSTPKAVRAFRPIRLSRKKKGREQEPFNNATQTDDWIFTSGRRATGDAIQSGQGQDEGQDEDRNS